jgi:molybdate transport system regulatory protein
MKIITISGAHSRVGKTTLARNLRDNLIGERFILKIGCNKPKDKPELIINDLDEAMVFVKQQIESDKYDYLIIESNRILEKLKPGLSIYIDGEKGKEKPSALSAKTVADVVISDKTDLTAIKECLSKKKLFNDPEKEIIYQVIDDFSGSSILNNLDIKVKLWLDKDSQMVIGPGKYLLLKKIEELESLNKASKELKMSYRHAWAYIKAMEERLGRPLLELKQANKKNSGSKLTGFAEKLIAFYENILEERGR